MSFFSLSLLVLSLSSLLFLFVVVVVVVVIIIIIIIFHFQSKGFTGLVVKCHSLMKTKRKLSKPCVQP